MALPGTWTLFYNWGCSGSYSQTTITFNANGTFTTQGYTGRWAQVAGNVQWRYDQSPNSVYSGNLTGGAAVGMMFNTNLSTGCFYITSSSGATLSAAETAELRTRAEARDGELDDAGQPSKGRKS